VRVLFFIDSLISGGKERRLTELLKGLGSFSDLECRIAIMNENVHYKEIFDLGIQIDYIIRKSKKDLSVLNKLYHLCKNFKPDIIHCWDSMTAIYSIPVCKALNIKLINGMITDAPNQLKLFNKSWLRGQLIFPFSDIIIGNSLAGLQSYFAPKRKRRLIYNGFDFERINFLNPKDELIDKLNIKTQYIVGMVATFGKFKDYDTYFKAVQKVLQIRKDITFLAIGSQTDSSKAKAMINYGLHENVQLLGERNNIESYINIMDICVLATFSEGISNSILEYMALGKPTIATIGGGTSEIIIDKYNGFLIDTKNADQLFYRINEIIDNPDLAKSIGENATKTIKEKFNNNIALTHYFDLYKEITNN